MADIKLFELGPTRSARVRWTLLEASLKYESIDRGVDIFDSEELRSVHPLGKPPARDTVCRDSGILRASPRHPPLSVKI